ncbi:stalk domain-containing protein [Fenollaria timonensis]|uniref:InlB B-repeat-containing protein n=1 Tax=Fenollaria timonensis TaxID=1723384 RepID=UPI0026F1A927|nr:stalk domain-containing protein [Fenollaria timonensis]
MKKFRNILAMLMVFVMLVAVMPMNVFAEGEADPAPAEPTTFTVTVNQSENGSVTANPASAAKDAEVTLTVTPAEGYELDKLTVAGKTATNVTVTENKFTMPDEDVTVTATFKKKAEPKPVEHKITIAETTNGTVTANPTNAAKDAEVTLTVTPAEGYELDKLTVAGKTATNVTVTENKFTMPDEDVTVTATFKEKEKPTPVEHKIIIAETTNGKVIANPASAAKDAEVTLTVTPAEGYELDKLTVAGKTATNVTVTDNKFIMPDEDVTITATFKKKAEPKPETKEYTISKAYTNHGSFTVSKSKAKAGETITVTAKPYSGYAVKNVYYIDDNNIKHSIKNYAYNDYYYYGYNGRYNDGYYGDYYRYYSDYENNYYYDYSSYDAYLKDRHYSFWNNGYRYWDDYDYKYYNKYYDRYYDDYYRYYDDYVDNYYRRYSSYEDYLYDKHYSHYRDYRYYDKYDYRYYNYTTTDTFTMPASDVTVYVEFTDWSYYGYYYDDYYYYRYHRDKKDKEKEEKAEEEKKPAEEKTPQVYEASATINVGSKVFTKVNKNVTTTHQMDVAAYVKNGRVMLPLRYVAEALGLQVSWVPQTKTVIIWDLTQKVEIPIKSNKMIVNGVTYTSDVKPEIRNSRTMLPIANVARALGLIDGSDIIWDPVMKQVKLTRRVLSK